MITVIYLAGAVISWKMVKLINTGVLKAKNPNSLSKFWGIVLLTDIHFEIHGFAFWDS